MPFRQLFARYRFTSLLSGRTCTLTRPGRSEGTPLAPAARVLPYLLGGCLSIFPGLQTSVLWFFHTYLSLFLPLLAVSESERCKMTETTNGGTPNGSSAPPPAAAAAPAKPAEAASPMPSAAATSGSEGQGSPEPAEKVGPPPAAAAGSIAPEAEAAAAAAKTPIRGTVGRIKAPPSATASMQRQAFSHVDLSKLCWDMSATSAAAAAAAGIGGGDGKSNDDNGNGAKQPASSNQPSAVATSGSSSSSSSSSASDPGGRSAPAPAPAPTPVVERTVSRTGREAQRWATDPHTGQLIRLTTGCVPIMRDGRILLCSSSRKEAWILPKGGWESDETLEESALRETFEEAGVLGTLGPVLEEIEYETRKAKKRRLERENLIKTMMEEQRRGSLLSGGIASTGGGGASGASSGDEQHGAQHKAAAHTNGNGKTAAAAVEAVEGAPPNGGDVPPAGNVNLKPPPPNDGSMSPPAAQVAVSNAAPIFRIQQLQQLQHAAGTHGAGAGTDDTASVASVASMASDTSTSCSRARMRLFPLYVSEVRNEWPESGRARKVLDIDAAIEMMESRPEFQRALIEVRDRRLHLTGPPAVPAPPVATGTGS